MDKKSPCQLNSSYLDIGAGDGTITSQFQHALYMSRHDVYTTEVSPHMSSRLQARGFHTSTASSVSQVPPSLGFPKTFHVISCLNVLDRTPEPLTLLREIYTHLTPDIGRCILGVVLPWCCPFVERGIFDKCVDLMSLNNT